ncbi:hypothetical protein CBX96_20555 [Shewanella sp. BC20]|uniref:DUF819 family protein n=1 Tax=Shewanella sp. BC20 TaxID=2004459 RepID=UPI000D64FB0B|nr:DUF819 family protein [Shewanella sp. BC20]PWF61546.1 hypothetical protein CBX96_20555 [Shewanella sp. BC20]
MISSEYGIVTFLILLIALVLYSNHLSFGFIRRFYSIFPVMFVCYTLPAVFSYFGIIDASESSVDDYFKAHFIPCSLFLLVMSTDFVTLKSIGGKILLMFLIGAIGVCIGGPISLWIGSILFPDQLLWDGSNATWRGMATLMANWLGGTANQLIVKEIHNVGDAVFAVMVTINVLFSGIWMAILLFVAKKQPVIDRFINADLRNAPAFIESVKPSLDRRKRFFGVSLLILSLLFIFLFCHSCSEYISMILINKFPVLLQYNLGSSFFWSMLLSTLLGLLLSMSYARHVFVKQVRFISFFLLYFMIMNIGLNVEFTSFQSIFYYFIVGLIWFFIHVVILLLFTLYFRLPIFYFAIASQCNIGGAASAPVVASAFNPKFASVAVLMAVLGYTWASFLASIIGSFMQYINP